MKTNHSSVLHRVLSVALTLSMLLFITPSITPPAKAQPAYNVAAAMAYAEAHWNDGQGLCAEFASNVLRAGGLNMRVQLRTYSCLKAAEAASGLQRTELKLTPLKDYSGKTSEMATRELDGDILGAGDLVIQWCHTHDDRPHVIICAGYDDEGYAVFYGHNQAMNKKRFQLGDSMAYMHNHNCDMRAYVLHVSSLDPNAYGDDNSGVNPPPAAQPPQIHTKPATNITQTSVRIDGNCSYSGTRPSSVGLYLGSTDSTMSRVDSDTINHNKNPFDIWYNVENLTPGTEYRYQLYAIVGDEEYTSEVRSFQTEESSKETFTKETENSKTQDPYIEVTGVTNLTSTSARLNGTCHYSQCNPTSVGMYFDTSKDLRSGCATNISEKQNPFDFGFDFDNLSPGTTYYYQLYVIADDPILTKSEIYSFTTPD